MLARALSSEWLLAAQQAHATLCATPTQHTKTGLQHDAGTEGYHLHRGWRGRYGWITSVACKAGCRSSQAKNGISEHISGYHYGTCHTGTKLERNSFLRFFSLRSSTRIYLDAFNSGVVWGYNNHMRIGGVKAKRLGAPNSNTRMVFRNKILQRIGNYRVYCPQLSNGHTEKSEKNYLLFTLVNGIMVWVRHDANLSYFGSYHNQEITYHYAGRGPCFVSRCGAGTWLGGGAGAGAFAISFPFSDIWTFSEWKTREESSNYLSRTSANKMAGASA